MSTSTACVTSADGTTIDYAVTGTGPGLVIVCGGLQAGHHYRELAARLADSFTVYAMDRRGRGASGPQGDAYDMNKECEDLIAVLKQTGASYVFGHSYGGLVTLQTALRYPLDRIAVYEPAVSINGSFPSWFLPDLAKAMAAQQHARAMALVVKGLQLTGSAGRLPQPVLTLLSGLMMRTGPGHEIKQILPTVPAENSEIVRLDSTADTYADITAPVLLIQGEHGGPYLHQAAAALAQAMPRSGLRTLPKLAHDGPQRAPNPIAAELRRFFAAGPLA